ncbi:MAG: hypothetical protein DWQ07_13855, partial [Chloroflexi bacterium]
SASRNFMIICSVEKRLFLGIACLHFRSRSYHFIWNGFWGAGHPEESYFEGIAFWSIKENKLIVNYPNSHYVFGVDKNGEDKTNGAYKPIVRIFKNAKQSLVDHGTIAKSLAPSYFIECLLYNVPNNLFSSDYLGSTSSILNWLLEADLEDFHCQNRIVQLFGQANDQWSTTNAKSFIDSAARFWIA